MATLLKIDFISDISCPWCVVGLRNMETALAAIGDEIDARIRFEPFELNPDMPSGGMDRAEYFAAKYRMSPDEAKRRGGEVRARAGEAGFTMNTGEGFRIYNTFDAHRLLEWAMDEGRQRALKHALFTACFTDGRIWAIMKRWRKSPGRLAWMAREREKSWRVRLCGPCPPVAVPSA